MVERTRGERLQIMLSNDELVLIDNFRFAKRMPSRAATVRELFKRGLTAEGFLSAPAGTRSRTSASTARRHARPVTAPARVTDNGDKATAQLAGRPSERLV